MPDPLRVFFYVQHLLGIGHLKRAAAIAAALAAEGLEVTVAHGGTPEPDVAWPGARLVQLPAARIEGQNFSVLIDDAGQPADAAWRTRRAASLMAAAAAARPHVALFELFPFGRRQFRFELLPLIRHLRADAAPRPAILASVRDILVRSPKPEREAEAAETVAALFDAVLVHGDPAFVPFDASFGPMERIRDKIRYTGYVSSEIAPDAGPGGAGEAGAGPGTGEVVVSAGGGAAAGTLWSAVLAARPKTRAFAMDWRLITGPRLPDEAFQALAREAEAARAAGGGNIRVERFRADFPALLRRAALSISQGGYNTTIDLLRTGVPAVVVPFSGDLETEQTDRAERLAARGYFKVVPTQALATAAFPQAIDEALADAPRRRAMPPVDFALRGAETTARIVRDLAQGVAGT